MNRLNELAIDARKKAGLTQLTLAERLGCSKNLVSVYERSTPMGWAMFVNWVAACGMDFEITIKPKNDE